ncbi:MAG TPA: hypothetical protein PLB01_19425 [Thermoanaerobaculia bacterium]|nr:hypothetical protein [Thermoanaerobaculia bacterium]
MRRNVLLAAAALALATLGCRRPPAPYGTHTAFVPVVFRSNNPGRPPWAPRVTLTNTSTTSAAVRLTRWPPDAPEAEQRLFVLAPGQTVSVPGRTPLGAASSLFFEGKSPFLVRAEIVDRRRIAPPLSVPILKAEDLARPGDRLTLGPIVDTPAERSHFCFTYPGVERDAVPFRIHLRLTAPGGGALLWEGTFVLTGLPLVIDDPWKRFHLAPGTAFDVDVAFLGSARSRPVARGMWVYGITTDRASGASRFLETRVARGSAR